MGGWHAQITALNKGDPSPRSDASCRADFADIFPTGPYERDCKNQKCDLSAYFRKKLANVDWQNLDVDSEWSRLRIFNADGHFAKDISRDVGHAGRRAIHGHGPLLWHL